MKAIVHPAMIKADFDALLQNDDLMASIATFVSNYFERESNRVKKEIFFLPD